MVFRAFHFVLQVAQGIVFFIAILAIRGVITFIPLAIVAGPYFYLTGGPQDVARAWNDLGMWWDAYLLGWQQYFVANPQDTMLLTGGAFVGSICALNFWSGYRSWLSKRAVH